MLCEECKEKEAVVAIKQIDQHGQVTTRHLCETCAVKEQETPAENLSEIIDSYTDFTLQMLSLLQHKQQVNKEDKSCPSCGLAFSEFVANNRVGCQHCYNAFREELLPYISQVQNSYRQHIGKKPTAAAVLESNATELADLKEKLQEAIAQEAFEEAAVIRDRIRELKGGESG